MGTKREPKYDILEMVQFHRVEASTSCCGIVGNIGVNLCKQDVHDCMVGGTPGLDPIIPIQDSIYLMTVCSTVSVYKEPWLSIKLADSILVFHAHATKTHLPAKDGTIIYQSLLNTIHPGHNKNAMPNAPQFPAKFI